MAGEFEIRLSSAYQALRKKAEAYIADKRIALPDTEKRDLMRMVHEIEVQRVELELQNEELRRVCRELEGSRNAFLDLFQSAPVALLTVNPQGLIEQINAAAVRLLDGSAAFMIGRLFKSLILPADRATYHSLLEKDAPSTAGRCCELRLMREREEIVYVHLEARAIVDPHGRLRHWRIAITDITRLKRIAAELRLVKNDLQKKVGQRTAELNQRNRQLARLTNELTLAEQRERRRIADALHDHLQQQLALAQMKLGAAPKDGSRRHPAIGEARDLIAQALETSRSLCTELAPPVLYLQGFPQALEWLARRMEKNHALKVELNVDPDADPKQEELKVLMFTSVRELLHNVVKHAGTDYARVKAERRDGAIHLTISDTGAGFDPQIILESGPGMVKTYGLFNIRERLLVLGGAFNVESGPGEGTTIRLTVPLETTEFAIPPPVAPLVREPPRPDGTPSIPAKQTNGRIRVMLVDDHAMMRQGLAALLSAQPDITIVGEAADGQQALELAGELEPDVILMDISMPIMNGISATQAIHARQPHIRIIMLSMHNAVHQAEAAKTAGAVAFLSKCGSADSILGTIRKTMNR